MSNLFTVTSTTPGGGGGGGGVTFEAIADLTNVVGPTNSFHLLEATGAFADNGSSPQILTEAGSFRRARLGPRALVPGLWPPVNPTGSYLSFPCTYGSDGSLSMGSTVVGNGESGPSGVIMMTGWDEYGAYIVQWADATHIQVVMAHASIPARFGPLVEVDVSRPHRILFTYAYNSATLWLDGVLVTQMDVFTNLGANNIRALCASSGYAVSDFVVWVGVKLTSEEALADYERFAQAFAAIGAASGGGSITSTDITDSTSVGRSVLTATDAAAARTAIGVTGLSISKTYDFSGGAHDYTADAAYAPAGLTVAGASIAPTSRLGDGTSVPHFALYGRASVAALDRTTVPSLRVTAAASDTGDCWPFDGYGANVLIWLPDASEVTIDLTLAGNPGATAIVGGGYARMAAALVQYAPSDARPRAIVSDTAYATASAITEAWQVDSDSGSAGSTARTSTAGVLALDLRIVVRDAEVELWSALAGGTLVRRVWRSNPYRRGSKRDMALLLAVAQTGITPVAGLYAELRALSITGARAPF